MAEKINRMYQIIIIILIIVIIISGYFLTSNNPTFQKQIDYEFTSNEGWKGVDSQNDHDVYICVSTIEKWNERFEKYIWYNASNHFVPDFNNYVYVYAFWEEKTSGGYDINITMVTIDTNNDLYVYIEKTTYSGGAITVMTYPDVFIQIPKAQFEHPINNVYFADTEVYVD